MKMAGQNARPAIVPCQPRRTRKAESGFPMGAFFRPTRHARFRRLWLSRLAGSVGAGAFAVAMAGIVVNGRQAVGLGSAPAAMTGVGAAFFRPAFEALVRQRPALRGGDLLVEHLCPHRHEGPAMAKLDRQPEVGQQTCSPRERR
ncbi:hypothetical protein [Streptomyces rubradiris]|uniref:Uncharacterized protein n=1 Tax=Streptomyces rubradiris TaxID=285531 RepID=A0ABQ3RD13_STRRR|nr:hypothetical protein [Streptomyces rubradiris]GHG94712.1 hypothetical protein GCM10018792_04820 [Streptomyces rubradiris]GHI53744.1 hypothetical protein Srubr_35900 [Streptomyces rubradiris]